MRELALFAGAGGGILGGTLLGWRTVCAVELDPYARCVLIARQNDGTLPAFPIWDDIRTFDGSAWNGIVDVVSGGFPCQFASSAAAGGNVAENLWPEMLRVVKQVQPRFVFAENVDLAEMPMRAAIIDLGRIGYKVRGPVRISARDVGANHIRTRIWIVGYADRDGESVIASDEETSGLREFAGIGCGEWPALRRGDGVDDGLAGRMDRARAIGNGQVPRVAAAAWTALAP